jgi:hypothetical protein
LIRICAVGGAVVMTVKGDGGLNENRVTLG